jgi:hypothetical protein
MVNAHVRFDENWKNHQIVLDSFRMFSRLDRTGMDAASRPPVGTRIPIVECFSECEFLWAKHQAVSYLRPGFDNIGLWCEAALSGRNAFCTPGVLHPTAGAAGLGLSAANRNMLDRFARSAKAPRNWAGYWEIDGLPEYSGPKVGTDRSDDEQHDNLE